MTIIYILYYFTVYLLLIKITSRECFGCLTWQKGHFSFLISSTEGSVKYNQSKSKNPLWDGNLKVFQSTEGQDVMPRVNQ